jgi:tRNA(adenine34) deaminase
LMTEFNPGTSPPPVRIPIRRVPLIAPIVPRGRVSSARGNGDARETVGRTPACMIGRMNYELFMGEALAEARNAIAAGERPNAAVAVVDDAMVARGHDRVRESNDPTAHAVIVALREAARKLGVDRLSDATIFTTVEPCVMCVGALLESDVAALVFALPHATEGAAGSAIQLAQNPGLKRRIQIVSGIRRDEAMELLAGTTAIA